MIVACLVEALFEEIVLKHAGLWMAVDAALNFEVDPAVTCVSKEVVLLDEFVGDVA